MSKEYKKYKLYRGGEYVGYVAIHERSLSIIRRIFENTASYIVPDKSYYLSSTEWDSHGNKTERPEGDYLASFSIEAVDEDIDTEFRRRG